MDLIGPIVDTKIKIRPSERLNKFIKKISIKKDTPQNIVKVIKGLQHDCTKSDYESKNRMEIILSSEEIAALEKITADFREHDEDTETEPEDVNNINVKNQDEVSVGEKSMKREADQENSEDLQFLNVDDIDWLYNHLKQLRHSGAKDIPYLHELLEGSEILTPENELIKRNPDLEARCVKLRAQQEAREYRAMTKGVDNVRIRYPEDSISYQLKQMNRQLIAVGQFLLSIFAGFLFGFKGIELMIGGFDFGFRLLLGVMCALIIALAEIYFLAKKLNEELSIPETTQLGGPPKFANQSDSQTQANIREEKEHKD